MLRRRIIDLVDGGCFYCTKRKPVCGDVPYCRECLAEEYERIEEIERRGSTVYPNHTGYLYNHVCDPFCNAIKEDWTYDLFPWSLENHTTIPEYFQVVIITVLLCNHRAPKLPNLPRELLFFYVFPLMCYDTTTSKT